MAVSKRGVWAGLLLSLVCCLPAAAADQATDQAQALSRLLQASADSYAGFYQAFVAESEALVAASGRFCQAPGAAALTALRQQWLTAALAWDRAEVQLTGPASQQQRDYHINFWPANARQIEAYWQGDEPLSAQAVRQGSVGRKGLAGMEYLLFPEQGEAALLKQADGRWCAYVQAMAVDLHEQASAVAQGWAQGDAAYAQQFIAPQAAKPPRTADDLLRELLSNLARALDSLRDQKLGEVLGVKTKGVMKPYRLQAWRSRSSQQRAAASMQGLSQRLLGEAGRYGLQDYLRAVGQKALAAQLRSYTLAVQALLAEDKPTWFEQLQQQPPSPHLQTLYNALADLRRCLREQIPAAVGVSLGFNSADGD